MSITDFKFSEDIINDPPPNQNPLIGVTREKTITNCSYVQTLIANLETTENSLLPGGAGYGVYLTTECVKKALVFEENYRNCPEKLNLLVTLTSTDEANQNPLIGSISGDTITNCISLLALIAHLETNEEVYLTDGGAHGLYVMTVCVKNALYFEDYCRGIINAKTSIDEALNNFNGAIEKYQRNREGAAKKRTVDAGESEPKTSETA